MTVDYQSVRRRESEVAAAREAIAAGEAAVPAAYGEVDRQRELLALGQASRGDVLKAQKRHGRAIDDLEQSRATLRALEKRAVAEAEELAREEGAERARQAAEGQRRFVDIEARLGTWVAQCVRQLEAFDADVAQVVRDYPGASILRLPQGSQPHRELTVALRRMSLIFPDPASNRGEK